MSQSKIQTMIDQLLDSLEEIKEGAYSVKNKHKREAIGYLDPAKDKNEFAQCSTCIQYTGTEHKHCLSHGKDVNILPTMSCNYYCPGKPNPELEPYITKSITPEQSGLVDRKVRCENCALYNPQGSHCELMETLNEKAPEFFDMNKHVDPKGCCNAQTPKSNS